MYIRDSDLNVDEIHDVIPICNKLGILHPQEGTAVGHFNDGETNIKNRISNLQQGVSLVLKDASLSPDLSHKYRVADMITGYGVASAVKYYYELWGGKISEKRAAIQGWGNVAAAAGFYLAQMGVKIVGIIDRDGGLINENGYTFEEIKTLFNNRQGNKLVADNMLSPQQMAEKVWNLDAEIFIPGAASRLVTQEQMQSLINKKLEVISCGANVPFADKEIFFGPIGLYCDKHVSVIPDFIANCGMARVFAYLHNANAVIDDRLIFDDAATTIKNALQEVIATHKDKKGIASAAFEIALKKLL